MIVLIVAVIIPIHVYGSRYATIERRLLSYEIIMNEKQYVQSALKSSLFTIL